MRLKFFLFIFILSAVFPRPIFSLTCIDPCRYDSECDTNQYCYVPMPPACAVCKDKDSSAPTSPVAPASGNTSSSYSYPNPSPTALRPNPFQLVKEEANKTFSADKDSMTVGVAEGPDFTGLPAMVISSFYRFITPFLSPGQAGSGGPGAIPGPGFFAAGSCPIPNGEGILLCGSYTTADDSSTCFHGSNLYWQKNGLCTDDWCSHYPATECCVNNYPVRWAIPILDKPACWTNPYPDSLAYSPNSTCQNYGYAADFAYSDLRANAPVALPEINGQQLNWELKTTYPLTSSGAGGILIANDGTNVYEMSLYHLNEPITTGGVSGQQIGTLFQFAPGVSNPHVHLELRINGEMVKPDNLCQ